MQPYQNIFVLVLVDRANAKYEKMLILIIATWPDLEVGCDDFITDRQCVGDRIEDNDCAWSERFEKCSCLPWDSMNLVIILPINNQITNSQLESLKIFFCESENSNTRIGLILYNIN